MSNDEKLKAIRDAVLALSVAETTKATQSAMDAGVDPYQIIKLGLAAGLTDVGDKWRKKEMFISHVLVAAKAVNTAQQIVEKTLVDKEGEYKASIVLGTAKGDLHDIGKNLVSLMMRAGGFKVYDLGVDVEPQAFIDKAVEVDADLIGISLIMSICLDQMERVCQMVKHNGVRAKTIIGGPATSEKVAKQMSADAYGGFDAVTGVNTAKRILDIA